MENAVTTDIAIFVYAAIFVALGVRGAVDWNSHRDAGSAWFGLTFSVLAASVLASAVGQITYGDELPDALTRIVITGITCYPPCLVMFASTFGRIRRSERWVVGAATLVLVVAAWTVPIPEPGDVGTPAFIAFSIGFVAHWTLISFRVVINFWRSGSRRPGVIRGRARLMALGVAVLTLALLVQSLDVHADLRGTIAVLAALSAVISLLGYAPPAWLRTAWRREESDRVRQALSDLLRVSDTDEIARVLLPATRDMIGATRVALLHEEHGTWIEGSYDDGELRRLIAACGPAVDVGSPDDVRSNHSVDGHLITRRGDAWMFAELQSLAQSFGSEELHLMGSMNAIAQIALDRIDGRDQIRDGEQRLRVAADMAGLGDWEWEIGAEHVNWSPRMHEIFGTDASQPVTYASYRELLHPDERDELAAVVGRAIEEVGEYSTEHRVLRPDGDIRYVHSRARVTVGRDGTLRLAGVTQDVTERIRAEQALRETIEAERELTQQLRAIDELKSNILAAVSHELRTPLTSVLGFSITLRDRYSDLQTEQRLEMLDHVVREGERLTELLTDLMDIDRLRRGDSGPRLTRVRIDDVVRNVLAQRITDAAPTLALDEVECDIDVPKFERIIENLVSNAEKHSGEAARIWVRLVRSGDDVRLYVEDDGRGVALDQRLAIFEPFNRGELHLGHAPGTGIGLALVAQFAQLHGGSAWVDERPGGGASFVVELPGSVSR